MLRVSSTPTYLTEPIFNRAYLTEPQVLPYEETHKKRSNALIENCCVNR